LLLDIWKFPFEASTKRARRVLPFRNRKYKKTTVRREVVVLNRRDGRTVNYVTAEFVTAIRLFADRRKINNVTSRYFANHQTVKGQSTNERTSAIYTRVTRAVSRKSERKGEGGTPDRTVARVRLHVLNVEHVPTANDIR